METVLITPTTILIALIALTIVGTVAVLIITAKRHKTRISAIEALYNDQSMTIIRTIQDSKGIIDDMNANIDAIEVLAHATAISADIREKTTELRDLINGLDELVIMQNIQAGLRSRERFHVEE